MEPNGPYSFPTGSAAKWAIERRSCAACGRWRTSMSDLKGKVAVVTGASKGIGAAIAKSLSAAGAAVVGNYSSSKDGADRVVSEIKANGGKATAVKGDKGKAADVRRRFAETKKAFETRDGLVKNAGGYKF